jgi:hypothetical protein
MTHRARRARGARVRSYASTARRGCQFATRRRHSYRRVVIGSTRIAHRAGRKPAAPVRAASRYVRYSEVERRLAWPSRSLSNRRANRRAARTSTFHALRICAAASGPPGCVAQSTQRIPPSGQIANASCSERAPRNVPDSGFVVLVAKHSSPRSTLHRKAQSLDSLAVNLRIRAWHAN